jgi:hypothetical protein
VYHLDELDMASLLGQQGGKMGLNLEFFSARLVGVTRRQL